MGIQQQVHVFLIKPFYGCRTSELTAAWSNKGMDTASFLFIGNVDLCYAMFRSYIDSPALKRFVPNLKDVAMLPRVGHFLTEQAPEQVNNLMLKFLKEK